MITSKNTVSVTEFRQKAALIIKGLAELDEPVYIFQRSTPKAVLININSYNNLQTAYEDLLDACELIKSRHEPAISWKKYEKVRFSKTALKKHASPPNQKRSKTA